MQCLVDAAHADALASMNAPAGHSFAVGGGGSASHAALPTFGACVPAAQARHASADACPGSGLYVCTGHAAQSAVLASR